MSVIMSITVAGTVRKLSAEGLAGISYYYEPLIMSAPSLSLAYADGGGYIKPSYGNVVFSPDLFAAKPADTLNGTIYWMDRETLTETLLYTGTFVLVSIGRDEVVYSIREHSFDIDLLIDGVDKNGNTVSKPLAMGAVGSPNQPYFPAQRTTDVSGTPTYYKGGGLLSTGLDVYDDYTSITASCTDRSPTDPYGTVSRTTGTNAATIYIIPNSQSISTLAHLATYIAGRLGVTASYPPTFSTYLVAKYVTSNIKAIDFLDKSCGFYGQVFYASGDLSTLTFVDRATADPSPIAIDSFDFFEAPISGKRLIKSISAKSENAKTPEKDPSDPTKLHLVSKEWIASVSGDDYGDEIDIETFLDMSQNESYFKNINTTRLTSLLALWQQPWASVTLPIDGNIYAIGRDLVITDDTFVVTLTTTMKILNISYDFDNETVTYSGSATTT